MSLTPPTSSKPSEDFHRDAFMTEGLQIPDDPQLLQAAQALEVMAFDVPTRSRMALRRGYYRTLNRPSQPLDWNRLRQRLDVVGWSMDEDLFRTSLTYLNGFRVTRVAAILAEAGRLRERRSSIHWYAEKARNDGPEFWLRLAISYAGAD